MYSIAVAAEARGQGLGGKLLELAHRRARERGCSRMSLEADSRNAGLLAWYEQHGYRKFAEIKNYYAPRWHAWRFQKSL